MSNTDGPEKKPPPQATTAWDPADVPGMSEEPASPTTPPASPPTSGAAPTQRLPVQGAGGDPDESPAAVPEAPSPPTPTRSTEAEAADAGATVVFTPEDIAKLEQDSAAVDEAVEEADRLIGTLIRDKWKVLKRLGAGSFGTVYKVEDVTGGWIEALKILGVDRMTGGEAEEMRARFLREAQIMKRLGKESKHIVGLSTYEEEIESGLVYFLMEFVEGQSLADALEADGPFSTERAVRMALQACDALMVAHEGPEGVVHRDLKLENLMLTKDRAGEEIVKVLDFGIAKIAEREADSRLTTVGTLGTPGYAAPEQLRAEEVDGRTDLFAFGVILYALLTGRDPWLGNLAHQPTHQIYELMVATDRAEVRPIGESGQSIPPEMVNVVMKLLRRDPAQRFQSARELRDELLRIQSGQPATVGAGPEANEEDEGVTVSHPPTAAERPSAPRPRPAKKKRGVGMAVAAMLLLVAGGATAWAQPWGRTLDTETLVARAQAGSVPGVWFNEAGVEGGVQLLPVAALADLQMPFTTVVPESERAALVQQLRETGALVDVSWEIRRLRDLAVEAQNRGRYFDLDGGDVRTYALRLAELDPGSQDAVALLRKVGERMAWDAEVARADGPPERAAELISGCLALVPDHPRCLQMSEAGP